MMDEAQSTVQYVTPAARLRPRETHFGVCLAHAPEESGAQSHEQRLISSLTMFYNVDYRQAYDHTQDCYINLMQIPSDTISCLHRARGGRTKDKYYWQLLVAVA